MQIYARLLFKQDLLIDEEKTREGKRECADLQKLTRRLNIIFPLGNLATWQPVGLSDQPSQIITLKKMIYRFLKSGLVAQGAGRL
ncbi:hypothetical protein [Vibrio cholerae]|uniref:hypothetical protein n=1 Tax=Vibrio cholerae TaxID=666 RepID=UPI0005B5073E|nr:hypothetical protein [Vibrio cholerae]